MFQINFYLYCYPYLQTISKYTSVLTIYIYQRLRRSEFKGHLKRIEEIMSFRYSFFYYMLKYVIRTNKVLLKLYFYFTFLLFLTSNKIF